MNNLYICLFGGTTEGRLLAEFLSENCIKSDIIITTEYGRQFVKDFDHINVIQKQLDEYEMAELFKAKKYNCVIDATHPFAKAVSENIKKASCYCGIKYYRIIRNFRNNCNCTYFESIEQCVEYLNNKKGNILLTTGSKDLDKFTEINNYDERIYVRILPMMISLKRCIDLGYTNKNIICMQGPFSKEINLALINSIKARFLVTKESCDTGGFEEKTGACDEAGVECLVLKKPEEEGFYVEEMCDYIKSVLNHTNCKMSV